MMHPPPPDDYRFAESGPVVRHAELRPFANRLLALAATAEGTRTPLLCLDEVVVVPAGAPYPQPQLGVMSRD